MSSSRRSHSPLRPSPNDEFFPAVLVCGRFSHVARLDGMTLQKTTATIPTLEQAENARVTTTKSSDDDRTLVAVSQRRIHTKSRATVTTFDFESRQPVSIFRGYHIGMVYGLAWCFSSDSCSPRRIVSGGSSSDVFVWNGETGRKIAELQIPPPWTSRINAFPKWNADEVFVGGGKVSFGGAPAIKLRLYNLKRNKCVHQFEGHGGRLRGICADEERRILLSCGKVAMKMWSYDTRECIKTIRLAESGYSMCYSRNLIAVGGGYGSVEFFDSRNLLNSKVKVSPSASVRDLAALSDQKDGSPLFVAASQCHTDNVALLSSTEVKKKATLPGAACTGCCVIECDESSSILAEALEERVSFLLERLLSEGEENWLHWATPPVVVFVVGAGASSKSFVLPRALSSSV